MNTEDLPPITEEMLENFGAKPVKADSDLDTVWENPDLTEENLTNASEASAKQEAEKMSEEGKTVVEFNEKPLKARKKLPFGKIIIGIVIFLVVALCAFGIWNRWFRYDDAADIVSNWRIYGSNATVNIDKKTIDLGPNAKYEYKLDTFAKIVYFKIGDMQGKAHYRFSWDRCMLAIIESGEDNAFSTALSDLGWAWDCATCNMSGVELTPAYTKIGDRDTTNTGIDDIVNNGNKDTILLEKISTKHSNE